MVDATITRQGRALLDQVHKFLFMCEFLNAFYFFVGILSCVLVSAVLVCMRVLCLHKDLDVCVCDV